MGMTKEEAIRQHRAMWNWIADQTEKREKKVYKIDYFLENKIIGVVCSCFACEYADQQTTDKYLCDACPIQFLQAEEETRYGGPYCCRKGSPYAAWDGFEDCWEAAKLAREIANLPERG